MTAPRSLASPLAGGSRIVPGNGARFGNMAALGGRIHTGLDLIAKIGTGVTAPAPGVLRWKRFDPKSGTNVELQHDGFTTRYLHLSSVLASPGASIPQGFTFARSGASGTVTGAHLHFEVLVDGQYLDPEPLLSGGSSSANVEQPPWEGASAYPLPAGKSCPVGYNAGTVNPRIGGLPFGLWFNRPTNPDGTINACVESGLAPGDNAALADAGEAASAAVRAAVGFVIPVAVNVGVVVLVVVLAFAGVRQALSAAAA